MRTDTEIQADVMKEVQWDPSVTATHIGASVVDGVVTLTGYVPSYAEKWAAEKAAERVAGVKAVADELEVRLPEESRRDDVAIARAAAEALEWSVMVPDGVKVIVENGWATLKGEVDWEFQKKQAEKIVRNLTGVVGVINEIALKSKIQPSDVKKKIEEALKRAAAEQANHIDVKVEGKKVILKGTVRSFEEYWAAKNAAWSAPGVTEVEADIDVAA